MLKSKIDLRPLLYLLPAFTMWFFIFSPYISYHIMHVDSAVYIQVAKKLLAGGVPYRDMWDHKPPMIYFLYALILKLFGSKNYVMINYVTLFFLFSSTILLYKILRKMLSIKNSALICFIYPIFSDIVLLRDSLNPNTEIYMNTFNLSAVLVGLGAIMNNDKKTLVVAGFLAGVASAFKQPAGTVMIALSIGFVIYEFKTKRWIDLFLGLMNVWIGFVAVWIIIGLYFLLNCAWVDFLFGCFQFNFAYGGEIPLVYIVEGILKIHLNLLLVYPWHFVLFYFGIGWCLYNIVVKKYDYQKRFMMKFFLIWHLCDTVSASMGGLFYPHYFVQWVPSCLIIMYLPMLYFFQELSLSNRYMLRYRAGMFIYIAFVFGQTFFTREGVSFFRGWIYYPVLEHAKYLKKWETVIGPNFKKYPVTCSPKQYYKMVEIVDAIHKKVPVGEKFLVWGLFPELYLLADREPASKYLFNVVLRGTVSGLPSIYRRKNAPIWRYYDRVRKEFLSDLDKNKPNLIVVIDKDIAPQIRFFFDYLDTFYEKRELDFYTELDFYYRKDI